jgi:hypothetical protein
MSQELCFAVIFSEEEIFSTDFRFLFVNLFYSVLRLHVCTVRGETLETAHLHNLCLKRRICVTCA